MTAGVEVGLAPCGALKRPFPLVAPLVDAHDKELDRRFVDDAIVDAFEPVVEPTQLCAVEVVERVRTEVDIAGAR